MNWDKFKSRKFWFAFFGAILPVAAQYFSGQLGWDKAVFAAIGVIMAYVFGQGYVDGKAQEAEANKAQSLEKTLTILKANGAVQPPGQS